MFQLSRLMIGHLVIFTVLNCHVSNPIINLLIERVEYDGLRL
jgi:hypothetical protein